MDGTGTEDTGEDVFTEDPFTIRWRKIADNIDEGEWIWGFEVSSRWHFEAEALRAMADRIERLECVNFLPKGGLIWKWASVESAVAILTNLCLETEFVRGVCRSGRSAGRSPGSALRSNG